MPDHNVYATDDIRNLRAKFPRWGILFDPLESVWVAVPGKRALAAASSPAKLTEQVEAAARGEAGPDGGDKTHDVAYPPQLSAGPAAAGGGIAT